MAENGSDGLLTVLRNLCQNDKVCRDACSKFIRHDVIRDRDLKNLLNALAGLLLNQDRTLLIADHLSDALPQILSVALSDDDQNNSISQNVSPKLLHEKRCVALGKLAPIHPDVMTFALKYFNSNPAPFHYYNVADAEDGPKAKKRKVHYSAGLEPISAQDIALCCYSFLKLKTDHFRVLWDWSLLLKEFLSHSEPYIRWISCQCCALLFNMKCKEKEILLTSKLTTDELVNFSVKHSEDEKRIREKYTKISFDTLSKIESILPHYNHEAVTSVAGITLPSLSKGSSNFKSSLVMVNSTQTNLHAIALGIATGKTLCLQGPVGCGKTALVEHLAKLTGHDSPPLFLSVQLGDQTDSKMLLGTYQCTDIPGEFVWKPGVLTQAAVGGYWLLLEDIDSCTTDVAAVLASLLETSTLSVPGFKDCVHTAPGFQLFFTQRLISGASGLHKLNSGVTSMLQRHWLTVQMEPLSESELVEVVQTLYPSLKTVATRMVNVFLLFSAGNHHTALSGNEDARDSQTKTIQIQAAGTRLPSTRDFIKWCNRSSEAFDVKSPESGLKLFQDAVDIFCCNVSNPERRLELASNVASTLGVIHTKAEYFCNIHKPVISCTLSHIVAGRVTLPRKVAETVTLSRSVKSTYSFTRPATALLERIASCIYHSEPVLLVGETGVGKTSSIQYLAQQMGQTLSVINMNQQSDSADLLGGYKPVELKFVISPLRDEFETLFRKFFSVNENAKYLGHIATCFSRKKWNTLVGLMKHTTTAALKRFDTGKSKKKVSNGDSKSEELYTPAFRDAWQKLSLKLAKVEEQLKKSQSALAFAFVEGSLVRALQNGEWVLLDEINLASAQTLECLSSLLEGSSGSLYLLERGDENSIKRHPNFRIFAAMNPATDVGKKELPAGIRNRFSEFFVDELVDRQDLLLLCGSYLAPLSLPASKLDALVKFYLKICKEAVLHLTDGTGHKPHYSLRTLCRALSVAAANPCGSVPRSLYEGILLSFLTQLDRSSHPIVEDMVAKAVIGNSADLKSLTKQPIPSPVVTGKSFVQVEGYWITQGPLEPITPDKYIMTKTVRQNLRDLVRVVSLARLPVLLQGETSVGKTSLITYLAQVSGNRCLRINNHEHTDLQEYIGCYAADEHGNLVFKEGVLVEAMRFGHWVILDELNLAPSDVLEALNRVLDDNRELFIPETQKVVKAHPNFMLFATQNPPGLYGGRKVLSRAFRNRFIELHFDEIPSSELETIMHLRCDMPPSYCKKMVAVMSDLQVRRKGSAAFAGKQGFITLRDLFRWGERYRLAQHQTVVGKFYDWDQHIADEGYLILAGRVRKEEERIIIQESLKKYIKRSVCPEKLFTLNADTSPVTRSILESIINQTPPGFNHIVWTFNMRRLAVLLGKACEFKEPILLVGETGCGKTTVCQLLAASRSQILAAVNCHMHSESADFLGGLRPVREHTEETKGKLFEWVDGPLIKAMQNGGVFLADEISLADDSVLERLNSLLEPERKLLLAEKGSGIGGEPCEVTAKDGFIFVGTMNPGGDYGKKELSPALRNRFTEIWCEGCSQRSDMIAVIEHNLTPGLVFRNENNEPSSVGAALVNFLDWFSRTDLGNRCVKSIRDIMTWIEFINVCTHEGVNLNLSEAYIHGACLTFLDSLGTGLTSFSTGEVVQSVRISALKFLMQQVKGATGVEMSNLKSFLSVDTDDFEVVSTVDKFGMKPFYIPRGCPNMVENADFLLSAPTTRINAMRVLRGLQLGKALLLEGSPGVGKTSLVSALAQAAGYKLTRINLSDQTDVSDLFGADLPVEGGSGGEFAWRDGPFLQALRAGHWILLDELNLASQSVLEGLNAVLDHRGDLFIPELGRTFHIQSDKTRLFACQNPLNQGGARKGLPQSFLNRFTQVHMETLTFDDLEYICHNLFPDMPADLIKSMVNFNQHASIQTSPGGKWGQRGAPWEMNLRDLTRWCEISLWGATNGALNPGRFVQLLYVDRMRTASDKEEMASLFTQTFGNDYPLPSDVPQVYITPDILYLGDVSLLRGASGNTSPSKLVLRHQLPVLQSLARCVSMGWLSILVGPTGCGKTSLVHLLAQLAGRELRTLAVNSAMDTTEILGGFEQADYKRHFDELSVKVHKIVLQGVQNLTLQKKEKESNRVLCLWEEFLHSDNQSSDNTPMASEVKFFLKKIDILLGVLMAVPEDSISTKALEDVQNLRIKLSSLKDSATRDNSLNAGGKFEWIDSILIKSLTEGCWLLVDNVNLCSAAVLDRLNGLLEPQGVLTVSERGVDSTGELITIQPHPQFRLFLTMDPRNGEISRAMRNRGVEIYIASSEGDMSTSLSSLDLASLLYDVGICSQHDQQMLLSVHEAMSNVVQGPDPPGLTELLHASFLFVQQVQRGMAPIPSLVSSFTKVYIQSRLQDNIDIKRRNLAILEEAVKLGVQRSASHALDRLICDSTLKTGDVHEDSAFALVKQRCSILSALANAQELDLTEVLEFLGISKMKVDFQTVIINLTTFFYQTCSVADVNLASKWLETVVRGSCHEETISQVSKALHNVIENVDDLAKCHLMWDRRWLPDVSSALTVLSGDDDQGVENRVALLLYITAHSLKSKYSFDFSSIKKLKQISVLEYSHAVSKGVLADSLSSDPIITDVGPFLDVAFDILYHALNTIGISISDELWWSVRKAFLWVQRFQNQAASAFVTSDKAACEEISNLLAVHYRWFSKYAIPVVIHLAGEAGLDISLLSEVMQRTNESLFSNISVMWHLAKKLRQEMGQPLPMASEFQGTLSSKALQIGNVINMWKKDGDSSNFGLVAKFLTTPAGQTARASLIVAMKDLFIASDLSKVQERLTQAEKCCSEAGLFSSIRDQSELPPSQLSFEILLWPFMEAVCLHATGPLSLKLFQDQTLSSYVEEASALVQAMKTTPSIPAELVGFFEAYITEGKSQELSRGISMLFHFCNRSLMISNSALDLSSTCDVENTMEFLPQHCPMFSQLATNLLFCQNPSSNQQLSQPTLDRHFEHSKLLSKLRSLLWQNCESFSTTEFSFRYTEVKSVLGASQHFINSLEKSCCLVSSLPLNLKERATLIIEHLQDKLGDKASVLSAFCSLLLEFITVLNSIEKQCISSKEVENETLAQVGLAWALLGCLESQLFSAFPRIDPTSKDAIKRKYTKDDLLLTRSELLSAKLIGSVKGNKPDTLPAHPHLQVLHSHAATLEHELTVLNRQVATRPDPPLYTALTKELQHFASSLSSEAVVIKVTKRLMSIHTTTSKQEYKTVLNEAQTWLRSQRSFAVMLERRFVLWYPDLVGPLLAASAKLIRGVELLIGVSKKIFLKSLSDSQHVTLGELVRSIGSFPTLNSEQPSLMNLISHLANRHMPSAIEQMLLALVGENEDLPAAVHSQVEAYWLLKSSVLELKNAICVSQTLKNDEWHALVKVLRSFMQIWEKQEAERREMEQDNASLYKSRGALRCEDVTDDEEALKEIAEMFPSRRENDFGDLEPQNSLDDKPVAASENVTATALNVMLNEEDMALVSSIHISLTLAFTKSAWLSCSPKNSSSFNIDYLTPWLQRSAVAARLISSCGFMLDEGVDNHLMASWILASYQASPSSESVSDDAGVNPEDPTFDFYRSPCMDEAKQCKPVLDGLLKRINELLSEWPEHPTLNHIVVVINRVNSFPIESPLARFLTGLEILLNKMKEWEENAHSGVSLANQSAVVTNLIIQWRRLELSGWKGCLNSAAVRMENRASRWWFYIFSLIDSYVNPSEKEPMSEKEIVSSLEKFMEDAPLGEFHARLDMILAFHCHIINLPESRQRAELLSVLWNLHNFYAQFRELIATRINDLKKPIEKKLKDYVKIARWNDINYWAVKETVFKTQRTLHKHIREFEGALRQAAKTTMLSSRLEGKSQRKMPTQLNPKLYIANSDPNAFEDLSALDVDPTSVLFRAGSLFNRSKKLSKEIILSSESPSLIAALDEFSNDIAETVQQLASLDVDQTASKAKQKSQAKNQLQMKRKALADLFRTLQRIGLSHHTGLTYEENDVKHEFTQLPPLDLNVFFQALNNTTEPLSPADTEILSSWDGCNAYLMRSWARFAQLSMALHTPHKDHGPPNLERLKGFPIHLLTLAHTQHKGVEKNTALMAQMRIQLFQLKSLQELLNEHIPSQSILCEWNQRLQSLVGSSLATLQQFRILLNCCPEKADTIEESIPVITHAGMQVSGLAGLAKGDGTWQKAMLIVDEALSTFILCKKNILTDNSFSTVCANFITASSYKKMAQCFNDISLTANRLSELVDILGGDSCQHPCMQSLKWLKDSIIAENLLFSEICKDTIMTENTSEDVASHSMLSNQVNGLMQNILLAIQKLYKERTSLDEPGPDQSIAEMDTVEGDKKAEEEEEEEGDDLIQEKHLTDGILKSLTCDFSNMNVVEISQCLENLLNMMKSIVNENCLSSQAQRSIRIALHPLPLLQQWLLLYQFVVQQQVAAYRATCKLASTVLAVFSDLASKGFCTPEGLLSDEEAGEGEESQGKGEGAMGLGDGEGEKDMSERIESEDQLDDARPAGEEKKDEDKDCKEEEKGIEMSENFDGKLQDVDPKGDEEDDEKDEDNDDAEKEMGDTENQADQLDQQIWGSDSEEEGDEGDDTKEEEGQSKEQSGEKEVGAKERETDQNESDDKGDEKRKENKPEINEMDDQEVDDDQVDPYHGNQKPEEEPDAMDLPDDLQLDDGEGKDQEENDEENPFDIDQMKETMPPESKEEDQGGEGENEEEKKTEQDKTDGDMSDDDENDDNAEGDKAEENPFEEPTPTEEDLEEPPKADERKSGQKQEDVEDEKDEDKEKEPEEEKPDSDQRNPSHDDPTAEKTEASEEQQGSKDQVASLPKDTEDISGEQPPEEADGDPGGEEKDSVGQAPNQELKGHHSDRSGKRPQQDQVKDQSQAEEKQQPPGHSDSQRSLGDVNEPMRKRLKTVDVKEAQEETEEGQPEEEPKEEESMADLYQHIKDVKEKSTMQTLDAATKEQAEEQPVTNKEEEEAAAPPEDDNVMEVEETPMDDVETEKQKEEAVSGSKNEKQKKEKSKLPLQNEADAERPDIEIDGEKVETLGVSRAPETTFHTQFDDLTLPSVVTLADVEEHSEAVRKDIQDQLSSWNMEHAGEEATQGWQSLSSLTNSLARDLSEQLRLVLEPTQATRMKGDFRTGRRINMRKVIPYIASQFRKDKIWMRRTKPSKREYQIMLAIDDSSSMADNRSKELAFESLALVSQALTLLEAGELGVLSFGEAVKVLHRLGEPFTQHSGARLLQQFSFDQRKTQIGVLVDYATALFSSSKAQTSAEHAQLLVVISDGRGVFSEGQEKVCSCVRRARLAGIFMVFVIIDNPENKDSILDIRTPIFSEGKLLGISSYMDTFPFPFYLILRDIANLPAVLSDALRQWFELVSST